jgi:hypothetical protein
MDAPSSTVITPSLPTASIAAAIIRPTDGSEFAEIAPTWAIAFVSLHGADDFLSAAMAVAAPFSMPRFRSIGSIRALTAFKPSR